MGFKSFYKETDSISVNRSHILIKLAGLIKISLTKSAKVLLGIKEEEGEGFETVQYVSKTEVFDKLFKCLPHKVMKNLLVHHTLFRG